MEPKIHIYISNDGQTTAYNAGGAEVVHGAVHSNNIAILWGPINEMWDTWPALP